MWYELGFPIFEGTHVDATPIRLFLLDDHASLRESLAVLLGAQPDMVVVGEASTLEEARRLLQTLDPDIGLIDLDLPDGNGADIIREMRRRNPEARVIVLTGLTRRGDYGRAVFAGAAGVLHKSAPLREIVDAIHTLAEGRVLLTSDDAIELVRIAEQERQQRSAAKDAVERLTPRQKELLQLLASGMSDKEMALRLGLKPKTVRNHMTGVLDALGVESRLQAVIYAAQFGVIDLST